VNYRDPLLLSLEEVLKIGEAQEKEKARENRKQERIAKRRRLGTSLPNSYRYVYTIYLQVTNCVALMSVPQAPTYFIRSLNRNFT
jgi:hypothetical protein